MEELESEQSLKQDCVQAFRHADEEGKGFLTPHDYKVAVMELCGYKPSKYEINAVWSKLSPPRQTTGMGTRISSTGDHETSVRATCCGREEVFSRGEVGMDEMSFVSMMVNRLEQKDKDELIRQVFIAFDVHLRGFITTSDCIKAVKEVAPLIKEELIERWFEEVDSDSDGRVTFRDFEMMMKSFVLIAPSQCHR